MALKVYYWNCSSGLVRKIDFVFDLARVNNVDIFFISEADIKSDQNIDTLRLEGYDTIVSRTLNSRLKSRLICFKKKVIQVVSVGSDFDEIISLSYNNTNFVGIYRPFKCYEGETERTNFDRLLRGLSELDLSKQTYIFGDFNIDLGRVDSKFHSEIVQFADSKALNIINLGITRARRVLDVLQESAIDFIITNSSKFKTSKEFCELSDHCVVKTHCFNFDHIIREKKLITITNWNFDLTSAKNFLKSELEALPILSSANVDDVDYWIRACLVKTSVKFVKTRQLVSRNSNEIVSPQIIKLRNWKLRLRKKWLKEKTAVNYVNWIRSCRILRKEVRKVRRNHINSKLQKGSKEFWSTINQLRGVKSGNISKIEDNNIEIVDKEKITDRFINFFTDKVNNLLGAYEPFDPQLEYDNAEPEWFNDAEIVKAFARLSNKKSSGADDISGFFIKQFSSVLLPYCNHLFNLILKTSAIPGVWKIAKLSPVHKKGSELEISNYRPVSNLISIAKIFELCVLQRLEAMDQDLLFGTNQHGFRKQHSTDTALGTLISHVTRLRDQGKAAAVYSVDLTAAFDVLQKEKLVHIMCQKQIPSFLIRTIHSYLSNRSGYVQIESAVSPVRDIKAGCIRGSILGPILFNIYMSHLSSIIYPGILISYADDSYIVVEGDSEVELKSKLEEIIKVHFEWLGNMGLICNMSKTELITFGTNDLEIEVAGVTIKSGVHMKVLGSFLEQKLNWEMNVNKLLGKCRSFIFSLRYLRRHLDVNDTIKIFKSHVISRLTYGSPIWAHSLSYQQRSKIRSLYFHIIRIIVRDFKFKYNRTSLLRKTGLESIDDILYKRASAFLYSRIYYLEPTELVGELLSKSSSNERHPGKLRFFDTSKTKIGRVCVTNAAKNYSEGWRFDYIGLSVESFKSNLHDQLHPSSA